MVQDISEVRVGKYYKTVSAFKDSDDKMFSPVSFSTLGVPKSRNF